MTHGYLRATMLRWWTFVVLPGVSRGDPSECSAGKRTAAAMAGWQDRRRERERLVPVPVPFMAHVGLRSGAVAHPFQGATASLHLEFGNRAGRTQCLVKIGQSGAGGSDRQVRRLTGHHSPAR